MLPIILKIARTGLVSESPPAPQLEWRTNAQWIQSEILGVLGRALAIRQVDAGSCNGCELEIHALNNPYYNIEGLGIRFVASPRHADLLLVTGPVSRHMRLALERTYEAVPEPRLVVAVGDCGCTGGVFGESYASCGRVANVIPVDVAVPGCPPTPVALLKGILAAVHKNEGAGLTSSSSPSQGGLAPSNSPSQGGLAPSRSPSQGGPAPSSSPSQGEKAAQGKTTR